MYVHRDDTYPQLGLSDVAASPSEGATHPEAAALDRQQTATEYILDLSLGYLEQPFLELSDLQNEEWTRSVLSSIQADLRSTKLLLAETTGQSEGISDGLPWCYDSGSASAQVADRLVGLIDTCESLWGYIDPNPSPDSPPDKRIVGNVLHAMLALLKHQYGLEREWVAVGAEIDDLMRIGSVTVTEDPSKAHTVAACERYGWRLTDENESAWYRQPTVIAYKGPTPGTKSL